MGELLAISAPGSNLWATNRRGNLNHGSKVIHSEIIVPGIPIKKAQVFSIPWNFEIVSWELYNNPTWGKGKPSTQKCLGRVYVSSQEGIPIQPRLTFGWCEGTLIDLGTNCSSQSWKVKVSPCPMRWDYLSNDTTKMNQKSYINSCVLLFDTCFLPLYLYWTLEPKIQVNTTFYWFPGIVCSNETMVLIYLTRGKRRKKIPHVVSLSFRTKHTLCWIDVHDIPTETSTHASFSQVLPNSNSLAFLDLSTAGKKSSNLLLQSLNLWKSWMK